MTESLAHDRQAVLARLSKALGQPRREAGVEVNWLLVSEADGARSELDEFEDTAAVWDASNERHLAALENAPASDMTVGVRRKLCEDMSTHLLEFRAETEGLFNARRETFATMLKTIRESARVEIQSEALESIRRLNDDGFLASALGMGTSRFRDFYGQRDGVTGELANADRARSVAPCTPEPLAAEALASRTALRGLVAASLRMAAATEARRVGVLLVRPSPEVEQQDEAELGDDFDPQFEM